MLSGQTIYRPSYNEYDATPEGEARKKNDLSWQYLGAERVRLSSFFGGLLFLVGLSSTVYCFRRFAGVDRVPFAILLFLWMALFIYALVVRNDPFFT